MPSGSVTIRVPACAPCCGVQPGGGECTAPTVGSVTCASLTGDGELHGSSKFQNQNAGDWNLRKAIRTIWSNSASEWDHVTLYSDSGCTSTCTPNGGARHEYLIANEYTWDPVADVVVAEFEIGILECGTEHPVSPAALSTSFPHGFIRGTPAHTFVTDWVRSTVVTGASQACGSFANLGSCCPGDATVFRTSNAQELTALVTMVEFDSVAAALARGSPASGSLCKTTAGTIGSTTALSTSPLSFSSATSVQATIPLSGLVIGEAYELDLLINRYTAGGGGFVDTITVTVAFTAEATSENYVYDVPVNTDYDYEFDSVDDARCAA